MVEQRSDDSMVEIAAKQIFNNMANTYTQLNVHAVFAVKSRDSFLGNHFRDRLFEYISGILLNIEQYPLAVGGHKDHVHIFFELNPKSSVSDVLEKVKANTSKWINENNFIPSKFQWQRGYGGFSYSRNQRNNVIQYIMKQEEHHGHKTFKEEYLKILEMFGITYDEKYNFEFYE
jgi:REP element-mobilizing transposase RayT